MATKTERILSYLPGTFATAPAGEVLHSVVDAFGGELLDAENSLAAVMLAHWVDKADQRAELIQDLACIAALYGLAPRDAEPAYRIPGPSCPPLISDEDVEEFRARLKRHVRTFLDGTVTVQGILRVTAEALGLDIADAYSEIDTWWTRTSDALVTQEPEADRPGAHPEPVVSVSRRFVSRAYVTDEAASAIFGFVRAQATGQAELRAALDGVVDLAQGVDVATNHILRLQIDRDPPVDIDFSKLPRPHAAVEAEIVEAIARASPHAQVSAPGGRLRVSSPTTGASGRIAAEAHAADAFNALFGDVARASNGADPAPAMITGTADLRAPVDLSARSVLRLSVDGERPVDIDVAGEAPDRTTLPEIVDRLNAVFPGVAALAQDPAQDHLQLTSPTKGAGSTLGLLPLRWLEVIEYPTDPVDKTFTISPGQIAAVVNEGVAEADLTIEVTAPHGAAGATLMSLTNGSRVWVRGTIDPGETLTLDRNPAGGISAQVRSVDGDVRDVPAGDVVVGPLGRQLDVPFSGQAPLEGGDARAPATLQLSDPDAPGVLVLSSLTVGPSLQPIVVEVARAESGAAPERALFDVTIRELGPAAPHDEVYQSVSIGYGLESSDDLWRRLVTGPPSQLVAAAEFDKGDVLILPRDESQWLYLDCDAPRFDFADFDAAEFPGGECRQIGVFDASQFATAPGAPQAVFGPGPAGGGSTVDLRFAWSSHRAGAFAVNLPADLPPAFGGRFDEARFAQPAGAREDFEPVVATPAGDPRSIVRALQRSRLVTAKPVGRVPIGWEAEPIPFAPPRQRTLAGGTATQPARIYLIEPGSGTILELAARQPGAWGDDIVLSVRPAGPARYDVSVWYQGARFERARAVVLGPPLQALTSVSLAPQPVGLLQAKAAGVEARATRAHTFDEPPRIQE